MMRLPDEVSMRASYFPSVLVAALAIASGAGMACGGATDTGLFGGTSSSSNGDGGVSTVDGGISLDDASAGQDSGSLPDAAQDKDTGGPPPKDSGGPPPPSDPGVQCGGSDCAVPALACCRKQVSNNFTYTCLPTGQCDNGGNPSLEIPCDDTTDCTTAGHPGFVCCATVGGSSSGGNAASEVVCRDPSECTQANSRVQLCDKNDPNACPAGTSCRVSTQTLPTYYLCF